MPFRSACVVFVFALLVCDGERLQLPSLFLALKGTQHVYLLAVQLGSLATNLLRKVAQCGNPGRSVCIQFGAAIMSTCWPGPDWFHTRVIIPSWRTTQARAPPSPDLPLLSLFPYCISESRLDAKGRYRCRTYFCQCRFKLNLKLLCVSQRVPACVCVSTSASVLCIL